MALKQENMASNQITSELNQKRGGNKPENPNAKPGKPQQRSSRDGSSPFKEQETEAARLKGQETRRRNYEKRMEKQRLQLLRQRSSD